MMPAPAHCWTDGPEESTACAACAPGKACGDPSCSWGIRFMGTTCLLPDGHIGEHAWTRDDAIEVSLADDGRARA